MYRSVVSVFLMFLPIGFGDAVNPAVVFCQTASISDIVCKVDGVVKQPDSEQVVEYHSPKNLSYSSKVTLLNNTAGTLTFYVQWKFTHATESTQNDWTPTLGANATDNRTSTVVKENANQDWWATTTASVVAHAGPPQVLIILKSDAVKFWDTNPNDDPPSDPPSGPPSGGL